MSKVPPLPVTKKLPLRIEMLVRSLVVPEGACVQVTRSVVVNIWPALPTAIKVCVTPETNPETSPFMPVAGTETLALQLNPSALDMIEPFVAIAMNDPLNITELRSAAKPAGRVVGGVHAVTPSGLGLVLV